jgi:hypothetical protein
MTINANFYTLSTYYGWIKCYTRSNKTKIGGLF